MIGEGIHLFSDGAARGNPGPAGWASIIVDLSANPQVIEHGGRLPHGTNNQAELDGAIDALESVRHRAGPVALYGDSKYVLTGAKSWCHDWARRGWRGRSGDVVANVERWQRLHALIVERRAAGPLAFHYLPGHAGIPGNERVDEIACAMADGKDVSLYRGPLVGYDVAIFDLPDDTSLARPRGTPRPGRASSGGAPSSGKDRAAPLCYLSLVGGALERHATWSECEARVRGQRGARFRKAMTAAEEREILRSWGLAE